MGKNCTCCVVMLHRSRSPHSPRSWKWRYVNENSLDLQVEITIDVENFQCLWDCLVAQLYALFSQWHFATLFNWVMSHLWSGFIKNSELAAGSESCMGHGCSQCQIWEEGKKQLWKKGIAMYGWPHRHWDFKSMESVNCKCLNLIFTISE